MKRSILFAIGLIFANTSIAAESPYYETEETHRENELKVMDRQEMEEAPSSTPIGGSRGGQLEIEKSRDDAKMQHDMDKQRQLYEEDGYYRKGL